jgi:hypothetical protein
LHPKEEPRKNYFTSKKMVRTRKNKVKPEQAFQHVNTQKLLIDIENVIN